MQTVHPHQLALLVLLVGCTSPVDFGGDRESKGITYSEYVQDGGAAWFDPAGASDIYHRCFSTRDGHDAWWRFTISKTASDQLVAAVARDKSGPAKIEWRGTTAYPKTWRPAASPPMWWTRDVGGAATSIHWCYDAGSAERHHGWYFLYDAKSQEMYAWHWNRQWSSSECTTPLPEAKPESASRATLPARLPTGPSVATPPHAIADAPCGNISSPRAAPRCWGISRLSRLEKAGQACEQPVPSPLRRQSHNAAPSDSHGSAARV
jgi:hypothetical protein